MPNTGKPSRACHLCRARRVQCDYTPSGCLRCAKFGKPCPGYRQEQDLLFRNDDPTTIGQKAQDLLRKKEGKLPAKSSKQLSIVSSNVSFPRRNESLSAGQYICKDQVPLLRSIKDDWKTYSVPIMLSHFAAPPGGPRFGGDFQFFHDLYRNLPEKSCLSCTTHAVSRAYMINVNSSTNQQSVLAQLYGEALRSTQAALRDKSESLKDTTLLAVWLLSMYEMLAPMGPKPEHLGLRAWSFHVQGLARLLILRGPGQFSSASGRLLFDMAYGGVFLLSLTLQSPALESQSESIETPLEVLEWYSEGRSNFDEYDQFIHDMHKYTSRGQQIAANAYSLLKGATNDTITSTLPSIIEEIDAIDNEIEVSQWYKKTSEAARIGYLPRLYGWNMLRSIQALIHHYSCRLIRRGWDSSQLVANKNLKSRHAKYLESVQSNVQGILNSIPYALGDASLSPANEIPAPNRAHCWADALRLIWPLAIIMWLPPISHEQRETARSTLLRIGREMGILHALRCHPHVFTPPETSCGKTLPKDLIGSVSV